LSGKETLRQEQARVTVRNEAPLDFAAIREVVRSAFDKDETADLVDRIRVSANYVPDLSFVAEQDGRIVGHIMLSYVDVVDRATTHRALTLSPVSVLPEAQGGGIGGTLIETATQKADQRGEPMIILEGSPRYYPRFGFKPAKDFGIEIHLPDWAPEEAAMVKALTSYRSEIKGKVVYPPAFDVVNVDRQ
jgi:putative acetyltransferase